jgi:hypothetical protein
LKLGALPKLKRSFSNMYESWGLLFWVTISIYLRSLHKTPQKYEQNGDIASHFPNKHFFPGNLDEKSELATSQLQSQKGREKFY